MKEPSFPDGMLILAFVTLSRLLSPEFLHQPDLG